MAPFWRRVSLPRALLVALALVVCGTLLFGGVTSATVFGAYNAGWDGASELRGVTTASGSEPVVLDNVSTYDDYGGNGTVSFVLSPQTTYGPREVERLERFVRAGGTLVVAADFGTAANELLRDLGASARFDGRLVRDERHATTSPAMPVADNVSVHDYTEGVDQLTLNWATPVDANGTTVLVSTSNYSYVDANRDGDLDDSETLRPHPVVTTEPMGNGSVVVVGDPSLFINAMLERPDNAVFARNLVDAHETVLIDTSHLGTLPPLIAAQRLLVNAPLLQMGLGLSLVVLVSYLGGIGRLVGRLRPGKRSGDGPDDVDRAAVRRWVRERYADWDDETVERVTDSVINQKQ